MVSTSPKFWKRLGDLIKIGVGGAGCFCAISLYNNDPTAHRLLTVPLLHTLDPETAHNASLFALKHKLICKRRNAPPPELRTNVLGLSLDSPIGLAAGYDKDAEAVEGLTRVGFGFLEVGSVTPLAQSGNPKPRVFRLAEDGAVINRYGFNSQGHDAVREHLSRLPPPGERQTPVGVNLGKNKTSESAVLDYRAGVRTLGPYSDYIVVNISSPNTPGLRGLQKGDILADLLKGVQEERDLLEMSPKPPLLVKISPDLSTSEMEQICDLAVQHKVSGLIVSNTTTGRPSTLTSAHKGETGGLSGAPLEKGATDAVRTVANCVKGRGITVIGCGGISDAEGVYAKLKAGADIVQLYTALVYAGPGLVQAIERDLVDIMRRDGYSSVAQIVGADLRETKKESPMQ